MASLGIDKCEDLDSHPKIITVGAWLGGQQAGQTVNIPFFVIVIVIVSIGGCFFTFVTVSMEV
jgi:hypothetical protein